MEDKIMKIYVAKILVEGHTRSSCYVKLAKTEEEIYKYASDKADTYADVNGGMVHKYSDHFLVVCPNMNVTITVEEHEI